MNAAARVLVQEHWSIRNVIGWFSNTQTLCMMALIVAMLASAIGVIYIKDLNRRIVGESQMAMHARDELQTEWSQLLLEQTTWSTQARIQKIAQEKIGMDVPKPEQVIMVRV